MCVIAFLESTTDVENLPGFPFLRHVRQEVVDSNGATRKVQLLGGDD